MNTWKLIYNKFNPEEESLKEALCTLGNGYFGTRGASAETTATKVHYPGTYISGVYNTLPTDVSGRTIYNEDFVNCPNWLILNYRIGKEPWFNRNKVKILMWKTELNLQQGVLRRRFRWQDEKGRITLVENKRIVSMAHPHLGALSCTITPENYNGKITVRSGLDGLIINAGVERYKQLNSKHLVACSLGAFGSDGVYLQMQTNQSKFYITEALRTLVYRDKKRISPKMQIITHGRQRIGQEFTVTAQKGQKIRIEKIVSIYTSRDQGVDNDSKMAQETISAVESFDHVFNPHQAKWAALWKRFDVEVAGDEFVQLTLRLHAFHLLQVASTYNEDIDAGMPARGLHGEAYRGHIFWDELYVFPFYNLRAPEITRALLMYRYRRLGAAKEYAQQHGYNGAMFPWQSASTGEETTQIIHLNPLSGTWGEDFSCLQRHVSISIAYNVWSYYYTSGDRDFLNRYGAEIILEIAHFWSSIAHYNDKRKKYEIHGVMGPDEYHEKYPGSKEGGINNNAYTNVMVVWVLERALQILDMFMEEDKNALLIKAGIKDDELKRWREITQKMFVAMDENGIIHQYEGYMDLEELDWEGYRQKYENIHRMDRILKAEGLSPDQFKCSKQADLLMLFYVLNQKELKEIFTRLGHPFNKNIMKKNFDYYSVRTSHGSTLSMVVHAYVAELLGRKGKSMDYLMSALESDLRDTQGGTTQEGIHTGVMGGSLDLFLRSFAGLAISEDRICLVPNLPKKWKRIKFHVRFKNIWFFITIMPDKVKVKAEPFQEMSLQSSTEIPLDINGRTYHLLPKKNYTISL
ncbi:glycoside hydrolase family 65 protein [Candidatus Omnitrophota bacterium]